MFSFSNKKKMVVKKITDKGLVAILISPAFGTGWSTTVEDKEVKAEMLMNIHLVEYVMSCLNIKKKPNKNDIINLWKKHLSKYPLPTNLNGVEQLGILWVKKNEIFKIKAIRGAEYIFHPSDDPSWFTA